MHRRVLMVAAGLLLAGAAHGAVKFEILGEGSATDVSANGSVVVGALNTNETFRWTRSDGVVPLGQCMTCVLGRFGGNPSVSANGLVVAASILTPDSTAMTPGIWHWGQGWQALIPPVPPNGGILDESYGSAWTLSDDGLSVGGLYWLPATGRAHGFRWTEAGGLVDVGSAGLDSRINGSNHDGSVMAGWDSDSSDGHWRAAVWVNGAKQLLTGSMAFTQANVVTPDGSCVGGQDYNDATNVGFAALWKWNGSQWTRTTIGTLPGTFPFYGSAQVLGVSANGQIAVGVNRFDGPQRTGFIWTPQDGMLDIVQYLSLHDVEVPADFAIALLRGISHDGRVIVGWGTDVFFPNTPRWFRIELDDVVGVGEVTPAALSLSVAPNPVRAGAATITFDLPRSGPADLAVYDITGRRVQTLMSGDRPAGRNQVQWDGRDQHGIRAAAGVYYVRLESGNRTQSYRIALVN